MAEQRVRGSDAPVASQCQVKAAAHAVSRNGGAYRSRELLNRLHERLADLREFIGCRPGERCDFFEVGACGEKLCVPGDDEWATLVSEFTDRSRQRENAAPCELVGSVFGLETQESAILVILQRKERGDDQSLGTRYLRNPMLSARPAESQYGEHFRVCFGGRGESVPAGKIRTRIECALFAVLLVPASSWAQPANSGDAAAIAELMQQIQQLQQQDYDLQERIKILEVKQAQAPSVAEAERSLPAASPQTAEQTPSAAPPQAVPAPSPQPSDWLMCGVSGGAVSGK